MLLIGNVSTLLTNTKTYWVFLGRYFMLFFFYFGQGWSGIGNVSTLLIGSWEYLNFKKKFVSVFVFFFISGYFFILKVCICIY